MKVNKLNGGLCSKLAARLSFARSAKKVTFQRLAQAHGTQRSNLSAFVASNGKVRNVSMEKIAMVMFDLGLLMDGLLAPGLHRWDIEDDRISEMYTLLADTGLERAILFEMSTGRGAFAAVQVAKNIFVFARLSMYAASELVENIGIVTNTVRLDRAGDSQIQALWMTQNHRAVEQSLLELIA
jgi:hypothetical protein